MCLAHYYTRQVLHNYLLNKSMHTLQMLEVQVEVIMIATFGPKLRFYGLEIFIFASKRSVHFLPTIRSWGTIVGKELCSINCRNFVIINGTHNKNISKLNSTYFKWYLDQNLNHKIIWTIFWSPLRWAIYLVLDSPLMVSGSVRGKRRWELLGRYLKTQVLKETGPGPFLGPTNQRSLPVNKLLTLPEPQFPCLKNNK